MHKLPTEVINATLQYLATKPFAEVVKLIEALNKAEEIKEEKQRN